MFYASCICWLYPVRVSPSQVQMLEKISTHPFHQGCGAGTRISGSSSGHQNFLALASTSKSFWLLLRNDLVHWKQKTLYDLYNSLAQQTMFVKPGTKFQDPAPQPCF